MSSLMTLHYTTYCSPLSHRNACTALKILICLQSVRMWPKKVERKACGTLAIPLYLKRIQMGQKRGQRREDLRRTLNSLNNISFTVPQGRIHTVKYNAFG